MKSTNRPGLHYWGVYQGERRIDFNGFFWVRSAGNVVIDPMPITGEDLAFVREHGGARWILVTNADHWRAVPELASALGAEVWAPEEERERLGERATHVAGWYREAGDLPAGLREDVEVHLLRGGKSACEAALRLKPLGALLFGDLVRSHVSGDLRLLPDEKLADRAAAVRSLQALGRPEPRAILLGDGDPLFRGAAEAWRELLASLA